MPPVTDRPARIVFSISPFYASSYVRATPWRIKIHTRIRFGFLEFPCVFAIRLDRSLQAKFPSNFTSTKFQNVLYNARNIFVKSVSRSVRILSRTTVHCRRYNCDTKKDLPCTRVTIPRLDRIYKFTCL